MTGLQTSKSANPLDATMTKTQVVRRKFKSGLPRTPQNRLLSKMEAMARTMELLDRLRNEMEAAGLNKDHASAGLVYHQPATKGEEHVLARTAMLTKPEVIGSFVKKVMEVDRPRFLGVVFLQYDPHPKAKPEHKYVAFVWPFLNGPDDAARLIAARDRQLRELARSSGPSD